MLYIAIPHRALIQIMGFLVQYVPKNEVTVQPQEKVQEIIGNVLFYYFE